MNTENIYLVGLMGAGKTSIGKLLAKRTNRQFIDLDNEIIKNEKCSITEIFKKSGEEKFRELESTQLRNTTKMTNTVISTGGGIILREDNIKIMLSHGLIIHLDVNLETQMLRVKNRENRPLIDKGDIKKVMLEMRKDRDETYKKISKISIDTSNKKRNVIINDILEVVIWKK